MSKPWTIQKRDEKGKAVGPESIGLGKTRRDAAEWFVKNLRPDLNGSAVAQNGSVIYGVDGFYYTVTPLMKK